MINRTVNLTDIKDRSQKRTETPLKRLIGKITKKPYNAHIGVVLNRATPQTGLKYRRDLA